MPAQESSAKRLAHTPGPAVYYRVLCPAQRIGNVIGKVRWRGLIPVHGWQLLPWRPRLTLARCQGGDIIQALRTGTGARIKVEPLLAGCAERVIAILAPDRPGERWCDAQQALFRVHERISAHDLDGAQDLNAFVVCRWSLHFAGWHNFWPEKVVIFSGTLKCMPLQVRLLVDSTQIGCILGKGGKVITELRRATGASVRVLSKLELPTCAERSDEVLQVRLLVLARCADRLTWRWPDEARGGGSGIGRRGARAGRAATGVRAATQLPFAAAHPSASRRAAGSRSMWLQRAHRLAASCALAVPGQRAAVASPLDQPAVPPATIPAALPPAQTAAHPAPPLSRGPGSGQGHHIAITASASAFSPAASAAPMYRDGAGGAAPAAGGRAERDLGGPAKSASDELPPHLLAASVHVSVRHCAPVVCVRAPGCARGVLRPTCHEADACWHCGIMSWTVLQVACMCSSWSLLSINRV